MIQYHLSEPGERNTTMTNSKIQSGSSSQRVPRAIIHKNILDEAEKRPDASIEEIADSVSGASVKLAEKVLEEYGDPASDESTDDSTPGLVRDDPDVSVDSMTSDRAGDSLSSIDYLHLSEDQKQLLQAIYEHPDATKEQLTDRMGWSIEKLRRTVNTISNFEWQRRREIVQRLFDSGRTGSKSSEIDEDHLERLAEQVDTLGSQVRNLEKKVKTTSATSEGALSDPDLLHRVIKACMDSANIQEEEELKIIKQLVE